MKISKTQILRVSILSVFLIIITIAAFRHQIIGGGPSGAPPVDALCPFGGIETIYKFIAGGEFLKRTYISNIILTAVSVVLAVIFGRFFCGWLCALGWMQEISGKIGKLIFKKRFTIPAAVDRYLRYIKYLLLVAILFFTWRMADMVIRPFDPFAAYAHLPAGWAELSEGFLIGFIILILSLVFSLFYDRVFCKYLCPLGAFLGIIRKISPFAIKREPETCIECGKCSRICPVNLDVAGSSRVTSAECISCLECVTVCPTGKDTLKPVIGRKFIKPIIVGIIGILIYAGTVAAANLTGVWKMKENSIKEVVTTDGKLSPENIRGFMTLKDTADTFSINIDDIYSGLGAEKNSIPPDTKIKDLAKYKPELNEDSVRQLVSRLTGETAPAFPGTDSDPSLIKGSMNIKEICETYGIKKSDLLNKLGITGIEIDDSLTLKDLKTKINEIDPQFEVENVRTAVKELIKEK